MSHTQFCVFFTPPSSIHVCPLLGSMVAARIHGCSVIHLWAWIVLESDSDSLCLFLIVASGLWFYGYNEVATMTIKKTSAVTQVR
jgi:hypothetical protein